MENSDKKQYIASISYGKDSLAMLHVITDVLHLPLDRIITADVWATDTIPADLPPMVEFKEKADRIIKERWGIEVEHFQALNNDGSKRSFESVFYTKVGEKAMARRRRRYEERKANSPKGMIDIYGFAPSIHPWCNSMLKLQAINVAKATFSNSICYVGIAFDERKRTEKHIGKMEKGEELLPLVEAEWTEQMCREWCEQNDLLSPIYTQSARGGCWFCHNQGLTQLRLLRKNYPDLWGLLLKWDSDSPMTYRSDGRTVHDFDMRFRWEDEGYKPMQKQFRWEDVYNAQANIYQFLGDKKDEE